MSPACRSPWLPPVSLTAARDGGNPAFSGCEVQILDDHNWEKVTGSELKPWQFTASLYGSVPAGKKVLRELGRWNSLDKSFCTDPAGPVNESCVENAECGSVGPAGAAQSAVAAMLYQSRGNFYICSGGLLSNGTSSPPNYFGRASSGASWTAPRSDSKKWRRRRSRTGSPSTW